MGFIKNSMAEIFKLTGGAILEPYVTACKGETQKYACGGVGSVQFCAPDTGLLDRYVGAKDTDVGEVWATVGVGLEGCDVAGE